jgi:hypothetical protein
LRILASWRITGLDKNMMTKHKQEYRECRRFLIFAMSLLFFQFIYCGMAKAATLTVVLNHSMPKINQPIRVDVQLDMQGDDANAIQGEIDFPAGLFAVQGLNDGASPVSFWVEPPMEIASGIVAFSGIIPGSFDGVASSVISLWLLPTAPGSATIALSNVQLLRNDGKATPISVVVTPAEVAVSSLVASGTPSRRVSFITPEPFTPIVSQDPNTFQDKYFLAFSTTDKGSGINYYEVLETPNGSGWHTASSPYLLQDQTLSSDIYVRAVDHSGNFIVEEVPAEYPTSGQNPLARNGIAIFLGGLALIALILAMRKSVS